MKESEEQSRLCHQIVKEAHDAIIAADREGSFASGTKGLRWFSALASLKH